MTEPVVAPPLDLAAMRKLARMHEARGEGFDEPLLALCDEIERVKASFDALGAMFESVQADNARLTAELEEVEKVAAAREKIIGLDWAREDDLRSDNARLRAELNAAADALDNGGWALEVPLNQRDDIARTLHSARDAARAAAKECA